MNEIREIDVGVITDAVAALCVKANKVLPPDLVEKIKESGSDEKNPLAKRILADLEQNIIAAGELDMPVCQDTGMAVVFAEVGQDVHIIGGDFLEAINAGVSRGYTEGLLRCSVVDDPIRRNNTGDNTPAILHTSIVPGDTITLTVAPKGFGSENMSAVRMLTPAATEEDIISFVVETVKKAGANPCPPVVVGVGMGGDFEYAALFSKKALCRNIAAEHPDPYYRDLEKKMLREINQLDIGPQGFGGNTTALAVSIEAYPTHIAGLPVAVNIGCHVNRHQSAEI